MMPEAVPASEPIANILRRAASLSGCVVAAHQHDMRCRMSQLLCCWLLAAVSTGAARGFMLLFSATMNSWLSLHGGFAPSTARSAVCSACSGQSCSGLMMHTHAASEEKLLLLLL
jgi:hypothetical protein